MDRLPNFNVDLTQVLPELQERLKQGLALIETLSASAHLSFETLVMPLSMFDAELGEFWAPILHLNNVANTDAVREVYEQGSILLSDFSVTLGQHQGLYQAYLKLKQDQVQYDALSATQKKIIDDALQDFELAGVGLPAHEREQFKACEKALVELTTKFEHHLMDTIKAWHYDLDDVRELEGLPEVVIEQARLKAEAVGLLGYRLGIDAPTYLAVMGYAMNRSLREKFYRAYVTRASELGASLEFDNSDLMVKILDERRREAQLLKYPNYAAYSLVDKMAHDPDQVLKFLYDLAKRSRDKALADLEEVKVFARQQGFKDDLQVWDLAYFSERLKEDQLGFSEERLRPYFPLTQVFSGLLNLVHTIFKIQFREVAIDAWDAHVKFLEVYDDQSLIGGIYVDLYARADKRSGAWMDECRSLRYLRDGSLQKPLAFLNANFLPPANGRDAELTHDEVVTLFHELGHVLQHILTQVTYPEVGGIHGIPWDAVELPSQFMENFCYEPQVLKFLSCHVDTGLPLSDELIAAVRASRVFQNGLMMLRQMEFALFDMKMHLQNDILDVAQIQAILDEVRVQVSVIPVPVFNRFQHSFMHIFAGGYAAGYYSYKWAELLSSDAFSRFEEKGILNPSVGMAFRNTVLGMGGSREAMDVFVDFRGREPKIDALLRHSGLVAMSDD